MPDTLGQIGSNRAGSQRKRYCRKDSQRARGPHPAPSGPGPHRGVRWASRRGDQSAGTVRAVGRAARPDPVSRGHGARQALVQRVRRRSGPARPSRVDRQAHPRSSRSAGGRGPGADRHSAGRGRSPGAAAVRCAYAGGGRGGDRGARPRPTARRRRSGAGLAADPPGRPAGCRPADGPDRAVRRRQRVSSRGALPQPGQPAPPGQPAEPAQLAGDLVRPGGPDAGGRTRQPDRHRAPRAHPGSDGPAARVDDHGGEVYVYRRAGLPCWVCGSRIRTEMLAGRNLFWCGRCQRRG